jgi:putative tricarboxylic transport membrane protein
VYVALGLAITLTTALGLLGARIFAQTLRLPKAVLLTAITLLCVVGSYAVNNSLFDVWVMVLFGGVGYLMQKAGFPTLPLIFGLILGPMFEENLRRTLIVSNGSLLVYLQRPLSLTLLLLAAVTAAYPLVLEWRHRRKASVGPTVALQGDPGR